MHIFLDRDPFAPSVLYSEVWDAFWMRGQWPAHWIGGEAAPDNSPRVWAFRNRFTLENAQTVRVSVAADERYILYLDGEIVGRGSERGDADNWFYDTFDFDLQSGEHIFVAQVWALGEKAPKAQFSTQPGFMLIAHDQNLREALTTGSAPWQVQTLHGLKFIPAVGTFAFLAASVNLQFDGKLHNWGFENGASADDDWKPARELAVAQSAFASFERRAHTHLLKPATLPPQLSELRHVGIARHVSNLENFETAAIPIRQNDNIAPQIEVWNALLRGENRVQIAANTRLRVLVDLENYYCAYPEIVCSGGRDATIRVAWEESLYHTAKRTDKGNRSEIEGKFFNGLRDEFQLDGGQNRLFTTLWWQCGRYIEITIETLENPLTLEIFALRETRYPLFMESSFSCDDNRVLDIVQPMFRALQMCSHETFMDCPYYEQLMYAGDTRLEILTTYATTRDARLPRKFLQLFDASRLPSGLTQSRYPSRWRQVIPPFSLWYVNSLHDFLMYRGDLGFVREMAPGARGVLDAWRGYLNDEGLIQAPHGWNFVDWVPQWRSNAGMPPDGEWGVSCVINWQFVLALNAQAEIEDALGEPLLAQRNRETARHVTAQLVAHFYDEKRELFADDLAHEHFSEHAQCLAILSGLLNAQTLQKIGARLLSDENLSRTTIYFSHYLFEAFRVLERADALFQKLEMWFELKSRGFVTTFESPEPSRSDCHAWGAHPLFHFYSTLLGIRPTTAGFATLEIRPQFAHLNQLRGEMAHPNGFVKADFSRDGERLSGTISLPPGARGTLHWNAQVQTLREGEQNVQF